MKPIVITTPPISTNALYRGRRYLTPLGKRTKEAIAWEVKSQWREPTRENELAVNIIFYVPNPRSDLDNMLKGLLDALNGLVWHDDSQIVELHAFKHVDKNKPRIELTIV